MKEVSVKKYADLLTLAVLFEQEQKAVFDAVNKDRAENGWTKQFYMIEKLNNDNTWDTVLVCNSAYLSRRYTELFCVGDTIIQRIVNREVKNAFSGKLVSATTFNACCEEKYKPLFE